MFETTIFLMRKVTTNRNERTDPSPQPSPEGAREKRPKRVADWL